jgi:phage host-nuclease inhibitor protein Gam
MQVRLPARIRQVPLDSHIRAERELESEMGVLNRIDAEILRIETARDRLLGTVNSRFSPQLDRLYEQRNHADRRVRRFAARRSRSLLWHGRKTVKTAFGDVFFRKDPKGKVEVIDQDLYLVSIAKLAEDEPELAKMLMTMVPKFHLDPIHLNPGLADRLEGIQYTPPRRRIAIKTATAAALKKARS